MSRYRDKGRIGSGGGEDEILYDAAFALPSNACEALSRKDPDAFSTLINSFCAHVESRGWNFDYTDTIARVGKCLWEVATRAEVRAQITVTILRLGESHNRWHVLDVAASLIQRIDRAEDARALVSTLAKTQYDFGGICSRLQVEKLHPVLRELAKVSVD